jgi:manganese/zinc/iron transport system permease protein
MGALIDLIPLPYSDAVVLLGAAVLGLAAGVLGSLAVLQKRSLVGDALAHAALPGVAIAFLVSGTKDPSALLIGAGAVGLLGALLILGIERTGRVRPDAAIGVVLAGFFSLGIVLLTWISNNGSAQQAGLEKYLFGQAAGLVERDVLVMAILAAVSLVLVAVSLRPLRIALFDRDYARAVGLPARTLDIATTVLLVVAIIIGLRTVGAILMVAMLVIPGVAARQLSNRLGAMLVLAGVIGASVGGGGAVVAGRAEAPTGPVIVLLGTLVVALTIFFAPQRGVLWNALRLRRERRRLLASGVLIDLETAMHTGAPPTTAELALSTGRSPRKVARGLAILEKASLIDRDPNGRLVLSEAGAAAAHAAVEQRRLWSLWLAHGHQLALPDAREPDPHDVRGSLGEELTHDLVALGRGEERSATL